MVSEQYGYPQSDLRYLVSLKTLFSLLLVI